MDVQEIGVADLLLDLQNPRHERKSTQREAIAALLESDADKLYRLTASIAEFGLSPIDEFMVMKAEEPSTSYIVLEGNRRTAALKLLSNPELAGDHPYKRRFAKLAKSTAMLPRQVTCAVAASRDEAKPWLELRHSGEGQGVGVIGWGAEALAPGRRRRRLDRLLKLPERQRHSQQHKPAEPQHGRASTTVTTHLGPLLRVLDTTDLEAPGPTSGPAATTCRSSPTTLHDEEPL